MAQRNLPRVKPPGPQICPLGRRPLAAPRAGSLRPRAGPMGPRDPRHIPGLGRSGSSRSDVLRVTGTSDGRPYAKPGSEGDGRERVRAPGDDRAGREEDRTILCAARDHGGSVTVRSIGRKRPGQGPRECVMPPYGDPCRWRRASSRGPAVRRGRATVPGRVVPAGWAGTGA